MQELSGEFRVGVIWAGLKLTVVIQEPLITLCCLSFLSSFPLRERESSHSYTSCCFHKYEYMWTKQQTLWFYMRKTFSSMCSPGSVPRLTQSPCVSPSVSSVGVVPLRWQLIFSLAGLSAHLSAWLGFVSCPVLLSVCLNYVFTNYLWAYLLVSIFQCVSVCVFVCWPQFAFVLLLLCLCLLASDYLTVCCHVDLCANYNVCCNVCVSVSLYPYHLFGYFVPSALLNTCLAVACPAPVHHWALDVLGHLVLLTVMTMDWDGLSIRLPYFF